MRRTLTRAVALGGLAAGAAAFLVAILSAFGRSTPTAAVAAASIASTTVRFDPAHVQVRSLPGGSCYTVAEPGDSAHVCPPSISPTQISYTKLTHGLGGIAGPNVHAVIVRLTRKGTVWAELHDGAFFARIPKGYRPRLVIKVLSDGTREAFRA